MSTKCLSFGIHEHSDLFSLDVLLVHQSLVTGRFCLLLLVADRPKFAQSLAQVIGNIMSIFEITYIVIFLCEKLVQFQLPKM